MEENMIPETKAMQKNPIMKTAKWAMSMMKNKIIVTLSLLVTGLSFVILPMGNMNGTVIVAAVIIIAFAAINIGIHLIPKDRTLTDYLLSLLNLVLIGFGIFCIISPSTVEPGVRVLFALFTIIDNIINLVEVFKLENKKSWRFFLGLFVAVIMIGLGIGMIIAGEHVIESMQQGVGWFLIINSLVNLWYIIRLGIESKKAAKKGI